MRDLCHPIVLRIDSAIQTLFGLSGEALRVVQVSIDTDQPPDANLMDRRTST
jgi:hypothetical protein